MQKIDSRSYLPFVPLKSFVVKRLGSQGYSYGPTYSLINILKEKGVIEIFDPISEKSLDSNLLNGDIVPKGIRIVAKKFRP